jgi:hypothetical protein
MSWFVETVQPLYSLLLIIINIPADRVESILLSPNKPTSPRINININNINLADLPQRPLRNLTIKLHTLNAHIIPNTITDNDRLPAAGTPHIKVHDGDVLTGRRLGAAQPRNRVAVHPRRVAPEVLETDVGDVHAGRVRVALSRADVEVAAVEEDAVVHARDPEVLEGHVVHVAGAYFFAGPDLDAGAGVLWVVSKRWQSSR